MMYRNMNEVGSMIRVSCNEGTVSDKHHYLPTTVECWANEHTHIGQLSHSIAFEVYPCILTLVIRVIPSVSVRLSSLY